MADEKKKYLNFCLNLVDDKRANRLRKLAEERGYPSQSQLLRDLIDEAARASAAARKAERAEQGAVPALPRSGYPRAL